MNSKNNRQRLAGGLQLSQLTARALDKLSSGGRRLSYALPQLVYRFYVDHNPNYDACILLAGGGRGGTTWVAEVINFDNSYRLMFEPFNSARVPQCRAFGRSQYLRPHEHDPVFLGPAERIFSGRLRNGWVDAHNRTHRADRRLVKDIRANLLLGWIHANFPQIPIILLLRHPCAVAYSRCKLGWSTDIENTFLSQPHLVEDYLKPFLPALRNAESQFERHVFWWCIETYVPLMQFNSNDILVTTYEDCVASPHREIERIFNHLERPFTDDVLKIVGKPSSQARRNRRSRNASPIVTGEGMLDAWQHSVDPSDAKRAVDILGQFGLNAIYGLDPLPNAAAINDFIKTGKVRGLSCASPAAAQSPNLKS